jgi:ABC-type nitrate/sulfonate/bicarbonate transport system substrate-binding protein
MNELGLARSRESGEPAFRWSRWIPACAGMRVGLLAVVAIFATAAPAQAAEQVRIGIGFGLAFLPTYICEDLKLVEKHARELHLDVKVSYQRFLGAGPMQQAIASDEIDLGPFGTAPLLAAWEKAKGTPQQILAVSGITTMPLTLLTDRPNEQTIADLNPTDRIAVPSLTAPQMYLLEMQSEKTFGKFDRLSGQVVEQAPANSAAALIAGNGLVTAFFSSPPFTQLALSGANVHKVLSSADVRAGKSSFLIMGATRRYIEAHPQMPQVIDKAMDDAARLIHDDPRRAAQIYLTHEPSKTLDTSEVEAILRELKDEFGSPVYGVQAFAGFMGKHGELKAPPQTWKDIVVPALLNSPST